MQPNYILSCLKVILKANKKEDQQNYLHTWTKVNQ